jgi:hypothetical protein
MLRVHESYSFFTGIPLAQRHREKAGWVAPCEGAHTIATRAAAHPQGRADIRELELAARRMAPGHAHPCVIFQRRHRKCGVAWVALQPACRPVPGSERCARSSSWAVESLWQPGAAATAVASSRCSTR